MKKALGCFGWLIVISVVISVVTSLLVIAAPLALVVSIFAWWHFNKKGNEKYTTVAKLSTIISALGTVFFIYSVNTSDVQEEGVESNNNNIVEQVELEKSEIVVEEPEEVEEVVEESEEENQSDVKLDEINTDIADSVEESRGFALGILDSNGEPTENGEPNPYFSYALFIHELTYDGDNLEMKTDAGFMNLTDEERTSVANSAQGLSKSIIGPHEDWESTDYQKGLFLTISNGDNVLGHSRVLDVTEFKWYD